MSQGVSVNRNSKAIQANENYDFPGISVGPSDYLRDKRFPGTLVHVSHYLGKPNSYGKPKFSIKSILAIR